MTKVPVSDNYNEVIRKAAQDSADKTKYDIRTLNIRSKEENVEQYTQHAEILNMLYSIDLTLKKIEIHLSVGSGQELRDYDID